MRRAFGDYAVVRKIDGGGYGEVWLAEAPGGGPVAVKCPLPALAAAARGRCADEAARLAELWANPRDECPGGGRRAHLVRYIAFGLTEDEDALPYLVMEYLPRGSLRRLLRPGVPLDPRRACRLVAGAARGAHYLHVTSDGVHRDIKPENILLADDDSARLADLGLWRPTTASPKGFWRRLSRSGRTPAAGRDAGRPGGTPHTTTRGTPPYAEARPGDDAQRDVYSLGVVLYECLTGWPPPGGGDEVYGPAGDAGLPAGWGRGVPEPVRTCCHSCLTRPAHRYRTAGELADALDRAADSPAVAGAAAAESARPTGTSWKPATVAVGGVVVVAGLGAWAWPAGRPAGGPPTPTTVSGPEPVRTAHHAELAPPPRPAPRPKGPPGGDDGPLPRAGPADWEFAADARPGPPPVQPPGFPADPWPGYVHRFDVRGTTGRLELCWVPGAGDGPGVWLGRTEVTQGQWTELCDRPNPSRIHLQPTARAVRDRLDLGRHPVESVTWHDADWFCRQLAAKTGLPVRLPTKGEWVWGAAGGRPAVRPDRDGLDRAAWYSRTSEGRTHPAGEKDPNPLGLRDVFGNVAEWVATDGVAADALGGYWGSGADDCRADRPWGLAKGARGDGVGFRVACGLLPPGPLPDRGPGGEGR